MYLSVAIFATLKAQPNKTLVATNLGGMAETLLNACQNEAKAKAVWEKAKPVLLKIADWLGQAVIIKLNPLLILV
ncbi:hypothetical protein [Fischerella sp. JS2]|uniref:hypothetical protein n=1 Tax=Fischerella sp. JS2 TaxID=2597771 RepID=UPI0028EACF40|nr:hypothetical protein [Fischerella sp. JS2]